MQRPSVLNSPFSAVRFIEEISRNVAKFSLFRSKTATFLWRPDCVAEREGFEPPIRFPVLQFSRLAPSTTRPSLRTYYSFTTVGPFCRFDTSNAPSFSIVCNLVPGVCSGFQDRSHQPLGHLSRFTTVLLQCPPNAPKTGKPVFIFQRVTHAWERCPAVFKTACFNHSHIPPREDGSSLPAPKL